MGRLPGTILYRNDPQAQDVAGHITNDSWFDGTGFVEILLAGGIEQTFDAIPGHDYSFGVGLASAPNVSGAATFNLSTVSLPLRNGRVSVLEELVGNGRRHAAKWCNQTNACGRCRVFCHKPD